MGWKVLTIWDCEIQQKGNIEFLVQKITDLLYEPIPYQSERISLKFYEEVGDNITLVAEDTVLYKKRSKALEL